MYGPREILNEFRWRDDRDLGRAEVWYVHRGAPHDTRIVPGDSVLDVHHSFFEVRSRRGPAMIPFHRVFRIDYEGKPFWERGSGPR